MVDLRSASAGARARARSAARLESHQPDSVLQLSIFIVLLVGIPSRLIVGPLGGAGTPAQIVGMLLAAGWILRVAARRAGGGSLTSPVGITMLLFLAAILASYIAAATRPINGEEQRSADLGMLLALSWFGTLFTAMDGFSTRARLDVFMRRLVVVTGALATLGLLQYITKQAFTNYLQVPGLRLNNTLESVYGRDGFARPAGTALHPIEFGSVLTMALPFALHYAMHDRGTHTRNAVRRWYPVLAIAFAVPISISRSAVVSTLVVLLLLVPTWPRDVRRRAYVAIVAIGAAIYVLVPGLLGTLTGLFTGISSDASAQSRTGSYTVAEQFIARRPWFGRGFLTFLPTYRILDNQYLGCLIEIGSVGLAALLLLFVTGMATSNAVARSTRTTSDRSLAHAFTAAIASAGVSFALFDAFSFPMSASLIFLLLGCAAACRRLVSPDPPRAAP